MSKLPYILMSKSKLRGFAKLARVVNVDEFNKFYRPANATDEELMATIYRASKIRQS